MIAVIMAVYRNDKLDYLKDALESLYNQTLKADIFIQVDGEIPLELSNYLNQELMNGHLTFLGMHDTNIGLAGSLNELLQIVLLKYTYIVRMDADDISVHSRIEKQVQFLENHKNIHALGGWIEEFNMDTNQVQTITYGEKNDVLKSNLMKRNPMAHVTICFRNSFFDTIDLYDSSKSNEDLDLWIRALKKDIKLHNLQEILVRVRTSNAFFSRRKNIKRAVEVMYLKFDATKAFHFGLRGYVYAFLHFLLFLSPTWIKQYIYKNFRG